MPSIVLGPKDGDDSYDTGTSMDEQDLSVTQGSIIVGDSNTLGTELDASGNGQILVGNGTTITSVAVSGDVGLTSAGVATVSSANAAFDVGTNITMAKEVNHTVSVTTSTTSATAGGTLSIAAGAGAAAGGAAGGAASLTGGAGGTGGGAGGAVTVSGGAGSSTTGVGGNATFKGGAATGNNDNGGDVSVTGGAADGTGEGGAITITTGGAGNGTNGGDSGDATLASGAAGTATTGTGGDSGDVTVSTSAGGASSGAGGTGGTAGDINITAGAGGADTEGASGTGGDGGSIVLTAGAGGAGNTSGIGGMIKTASMPVKAMAGAPTAKTTNDTLTAAQLLQGWITVNQGAGGTSTQTTPTGTQIEAALPAGFATNDSFDFILINISTNAAEDAILAGGSGVTLVGDTTVASIDAAGEKSSSGVWRFMRTGSNAFSAYRIS